MKAQSERTDARGWETLTCPACQEPLRAEHDQLTCSRCDNAWPVTDGVPSFISDFPYWGEIPQPQMTEINRQAGIGPWKAALLASHSPAAQRASEMILNLNRANWCLLTDLPKDTRVLDLGAGLGATSHALALRYREVIAVEPVAERVQFMRERFQQERIRNVGIIRTSLWDLPFPSGSFDLIVMNGVLEWVAQGRAGNPKALQKTALETALRLLRKGGTLYLGIENRFAFGYFLGYPDPHSGMPWVTILPRFLADRYARYKGEPDGYRNYLYSSTGYQKLLRQCGFGQSSCYLALPSYNNPRFYLPLEDNLFAYLSRTFLGGGAGLRGITKELLLRLGLLKYLDYSFALLATK